MRDPNFIVMSSMGFQMECQSGSDGRWLFKAISPKIEITLKFNKPPNIRTHVFSIDSVAQATEQNILSFAHWHCLSLHYCETTYAALAKPQQQICYQNIRKTIRFVFMFSSCDKLRRIIPHIIERKSSFRSKCLVVEGAHRHTYTSAVRHNHYNGRSSNSSRSMKPASVFWARMWMP